MSAFNEILRKLKMTEKRQSEALESTRQQIAEIEAFLNTSPPTAGKKR